MEILRFLLFFITFWSSGVVFAYPMEKREPFRKRFVFASVVLWALFIAISFIESTSLVAASLVRTCACLVMMCFIYFCWDLTWSVALFDSIWAVSIWQFLREEWQVIRTVLIERSGIDSEIYIVFVLLLFAAGHLACFYTIARWMPNDRKKHLGPRQMFSAILIFFMIQMLSFAPALQNIQIEDDNWKLMIVEQLLCLVVLYMQNELFKKSDMKQELALMNLLWQKEQEQYHLTKENIAFINQKSHDLKHQIRALRYASKEEFEEYLDEMEEKVRIYDAIVKTGNDVFDTILTEKSLYCKEREIQVTCVADGSQMDFINTVDLYAILGNAMDNAIEAVEKFEETEKRQIDVIIYRQQNFLVMNIINPMPERLVYKDELPVSTKGDKRFHGFGLRSIKYIAKKYDGYVTISEEDGCFSLKILMPIPNKV